MLMPDVPWWGRVLVLYLGVLCGGVVFALARFVMEHWGVVVFVVFLAWCVVSAVASYARHGDEPDGAVAVSVMGVVAGAVLAASREMLSVFSG